MIYLASPYSHADPAVREERFQAACEATAWLLSRGDVVFSPIVHSHPLLAFGLPNTWEFWETHDRQYLARCERLLVLTLPGWLESVGVMAEVRMATELQMPVSFASLRELQADAP